MSTVDADVNYQPDGTEAPFIFVATNTVRGGMLSEERRRAPELGRLHPKSGAAIDRLP